MVGDRQAEAKDNGEEKEKHEGEEMKKTKRKTEPAAKKAAGKVKKQTRPAAKPAKTKAPKRPPAKRPAAKITKKPAVTNATGNKSIQKETPHKEKVALLERLISALKNQLKQLKRKSSPVRNEYRYNIDEEHVNYVFWVDDDDYRSLGFTHEEKTFGKENMPLKQNPKKGDDKKSYIRNGVIEGRKHSYSKKTAKNYKLKGDDFANAKSKIRNYKRNNNPKKHKKN